MGYKNYGKVKIEEAGGFCVPLNFGIIKARYCRDFAIELENKTGFALVGDMYDARRNEKPVLKNAFVVHAETEEELRTVVEIYITPLYKFALDRVVDICDGDKNSIHCWG